MDASCLYQCFRRRCNIMGDFLAHFSVPAEHFCWSCPFVTTVCHRWCFQQENTSQFTSSQAGFLVMTLISAPKQPPQPGEREIQIMDAGVMMSWWCRMTTICEECLSSLLLLSESEGKTGPTQGQQGVPNEVTRVYFTQLPIILITPSSECL